MRQRRGGLIINLGSVAAGLPIPFHGYLSSSKAAVAVTPSAQGERFTQMTAGASIGDYVG